MTCRNPLGSGFAVLLAATACLSPALTEVALAQSATTIGCVGTGGSRSEWDVFDGLGYAFNDSQSAFAGYRAMKASYRNGDFVYNAPQQGPVLGLSARF